MEVVYPLQVSHDVVHALPSNDCNSPCRIFVLLLQLFLHNPLEPSKLRYLTHRENICLSAGDEVKYMAMSTDTVDDTSSGA